MRVTLLGHASVLVEMDGATVLMDPVFFDPFEEGAVVSCPRRTVHRVRLPPIDILVVSHRHPDHFDVASLDQVPRDCDAICPADPLIVHGLRGLGFAHVHPVHPMGEIAGDRFELFPTRSEIRSIPEFGMVFHDRSGTFWNQVDSSLSLDTIGAVRDRFSHIDLLFAMYASQNFDFFEDRSTGFPFEAHRDNLASALRIGARLVVPASAGFRFAADLCWLNPLLFPISRERFVGDLHSLDADVRTSMMNPGDVIEIDGDELRRAPGASGVAVTDCDDTHLIRFDPTAPIPELADPNPDHHPIGELVSRTEELVIEPLCRYVNSARGEADRVLAAYRSSGATYDLDVVLPDGAVRSRRLEFGVPGAQLVHRIASSVLLDWATNAKSFFFVRGWSRRAQLSYRVERGGEGVNISPVSLPDLLMHYVLNVAPGSELAAKDHLDRQLRTLIASGRDLIDHRK